MSPNRRRKTFVSRIHIISIFVLLMALILIARCYVVQVYKHDFYIDKGNKQYVHTVADVFDRGNIYFSTKTNELVSAAAIKSGYEFSVNPTQVTDAQALCDAVLSYIAIDKDLCVLRTTLPERTSVILDPQITDEAEAEIEKLGLRGVYLRKTKWRYYPANDLEARTIGFTSNVEGDEAVGSYGLERSYNDILRRDAGGYKVDLFAEIFTNLKGTDQDDLTDKQGDIVTTIEPTVARMLTKELRAAHDKWHSNLTGGIIMDPKTGEIFALDAVPGFNLNDRTGATIQDFQNPLVEDVYEFGSIIKALTMASGLDSGVVTPSSTYYDAGVLEMDGFKISNYDGRGRGTVDMQEVLNQSLNTGASYVAKTMGKTKFRDYFLGLKIGSESGIDLPNEAYGLVSNLNSPRDVEYATASFGQGIALTPIAATRALAALGNGGYLVTPHLVKKVIYEDGEEKIVNYPKGDQVFSEETSEQISRMLTIVVDDALRGGTVKLPNYNVAAKTGTAQIADNVHGGYYSDRYLHSFFGYFPSYDPRFIVFLYTVEPKGVKYASETLTETFMNITKFLINYYSIPPDR